MNNYFYEAHPLAEVDVRVLRAIPWLWKNAGNLLENAVKVYDVLVIRTLRGSDLMHFLSSWWHEMIGIFQYLAMFIRNVSGTKNTVKYPWLRLMWASRLSIGNTDVNVWWDMV